MVNKTFKTLTLGIAALSAAFFIGCMGNDAQSTQEYATLSVKVGTGDINAASKSGLSKGSTIKLKKLIITMISNSTSPTASDTIRDTIRPGRQNFDSLSTTTQTIDSIYVLKALRTWTITVKTLDAKDSVIHIKQDSVVRLLAGKDVSLNMTLSPRFVMYTATFNFPDSLTTAATSFRQKLNVTRLIMVVGTDSVVNQAQAYAATTNYTVGYDYVPVLTGPVAVKLYVIGNLTGWSFAGDSLLYSKIDLSVGSLSGGQDGSTTATLNYVGPQTGKENLTMTITKVGLYQITATTPAPVILKGSK